MLDRLSCFRGSIGLMTLLCVCLASGCPRSADHASTSGTTESGDDPNKALRLEPYDAPTLEELDATANWVDNPVVDAMEEFRKLKAKEPPLVSVAEALKLKNNSEEDNKKILSALGQPFASESEVNMDAEFKRHLTGDIRSTNPLMMSSVSDFEVAGLTSVGFMSFDHNMEPFAMKETVAKWQTSENRLYDKIVIRDDLVWSDGTPITAHDVMFSFQTIMDPDIPLPAVKTGMDSIRWVQAYDDYTFVVFHKEALATNVWNLNFPVIPKHIYEKSIPEDKSLVKTDYHQKYEMNPVVGGPYKIVKRVKGQEILLERREDWYMHKGKQVRAKPNFKYVRFRVIDDSTTARLALQEGKLEEMELQPRQWVEQTNDDAFYRRNTKVRGVQWVYYYFGWNMKTPYFSDLRVRQAMSYAVNYNEILDKLCYGLYEQATGEFAEGNWAAPPKPRTPYHQDLAKADQLLTEAGWVDTDGDGIRDKEVNGKRIKFEFSIICPSVQERIDICNSLRESLSRLGVICNVRPTEFTVMQQLTQDRKFQAMFGGWGTGTDPATTKNLWATGENRNYTNFSNPRVDELFRLGEKEFDQEKRAKIYQEIDQILWDEQPYTWLYFRSAFYAFNKDLRGYMFSPRGPYNYSPGFSSIWAAQAP